MKKSIFNLKNVQELNEKEQLSINGGGPKIIVNGVIDRGGIFAKITGSGNK